MTTATGAATTNNSILQSYLDKQAKNIAADQASSSPSSSSSGAPATQGIFKNENTFLNILTTQLQHQDPTAATDTNAFTQELVQFAQVEQQLNTNTSLQKLISLQQSNSGVTAALNYMNGYVEVPTSTGQMSLQNSSSEIAYTLPRTAQVSAIRITDSSGNFVTTLNGPVNAGLNYALWNGQDSNGNQMPDGDYTFTITSVDSNGNSENITDTRFIGQVTGVTSNKDGSTNLSIGTLSVPTSSVDAVYMSSTLPKITPSPNS